MFMFMLHVTTMSSNHLVIVVEFYTFSTLLHKVSQDLWDIQYYMIFCVQI